MTAIALLIEPGATSSSVATTLDAFRIAARFDSGDPFRVDLYSAQGGAVPLGEGLSLESRPLPARLDGYDAVILPGFFASELRELVRQIESGWRPAIERLRALAGSTLVAGSCYGTFVLAEGGLLDGRAATTSWWFQAEFASRYPQVRLDAARVLVEEGNVITAGAMTAHTDLVLQVLRRLKGHALARSVGSIMLVDESRSSQLPFVALRRRFADPLVDPGVEWMERHLTDPFSAAALAGSLNVSYRTLHRRFHSVTGMAPLVYLHSLRIEHAKALLEETGRSVDQIAAAVGYGDDSSFRRLFARHTGLTPAGYRRRFRGKEARRE